MGAKKTIRYSTILLCLVLTGLIACQSAVPTIESTVFNSPLELQTLTPSIQIKACVESGIFPSPGLDYGLPGSLVYSYRGEFYLVGGTPLLNRPLLIEEPAEGLASMIGFSPDGEWFAYFTGSAYEGYPYRLHLISAKGNELTTIPAYEIVSIQKGDYAGAWSVRWLTNHYMLIAISAPMENYRDRLIYAVIDPFTGKWNESILDDLPDRATARGHEGAVAFDQSLSRVLYAANMQGDNDFSIVSPVLWDAKHQMELWRGRELYDSGFTYSRRGSASWSPDASQVAFVGPENPDFSGKLRSSQQGIYLLDRSGDSLRVITNFLATKGIFSTGGLSWSPDGRYLAFQLLLHTDTNEEATYSIYLYDLETDQVIYLCSREQTVYFDTDAPVWSPDGHYLAYTSTNYSSEGSQVIKSLNVVNIHTGEVVTVAEPIGQLGGWSGVWP